MAKDEQKEFELIQGKQPPSPMDGVPTSFALKQAAQFPDVAAALAGEVPVISPSRSRGGDVRIFRAEE